MDLIDIDSSEARRVTPSTGRKESKGELISSAYRQLEGAHASGRCDGSAGT